MSKGHWQKAALFLACSAAWSCGDASRGATGGVETARTTQEALSSGRDHAVSIDYAGVQVPIAGVAGGRDVVFVGEPLNGAVIALSRSTGRQIGELPQPPGGFVVPFIMHAFGDNRVVVLGAGGLPQPVPFTPANPFLYEFKYDFDHGVFTAQLVRFVTFSSVLIGFSEDFVRLDDGRILVSDAVLGSIWIVEKDGTISPGIVPKSFDPQDFIPTLAFCPTMPEITVNGYPFLFTGSSLPGVGPMAVRDGIVYYSSPCARGIYAFPLRILSDGRAPYQRAADISLVVPTAPDVQVEELLDFAFNPFSPADPHLYAANALKLELIRINLEDGHRQVIASGPRLFDFPSSLGFLPPRDDDDGSVSTLVVVSNQQERTPLTNDAVTETTFHLPFVVAKVFLRNDDH